MALVEDLDGEAVYGSFYPQELSKIVWNPSLKSIDAIHQTRIKGKRKEYLVTFIGWPAGVKEWVTDPEKPVKVEPAQATSKVDAGQPTPEPEKPGKGLPATHEP